MPDSADKNPQLTRRIVWAVILIGLGLLFLLGNLGVEFPYVSRWWAWVILLIALIPIVRAVLEYRSSGRLSAFFWRQVAHAGLLVLVSLVFLLRLPWGTWWPLFMIYGGVWALLGSARSKAD